MKGRHLVYSMLVGALVLLSAAVWPAQAVEYRVQVTHLDYLTFSSYADHSTPGWRGEATMRRLEGRLDRMEFPTAAVIPGREVQLLQDPRFGGKVPARLAVLPATGDQAWTTFVMQANPGDTVAFVVKSEMVAWQQVEAVAANPQGTLRRLSIGGPALFGRPWQEVPDVSADFIATAADRRTFTDWLAANAKAVDGVSLVVGRGHHALYNPDRVYMVITLPPEPRTFKLVIGWEDRGGRGTG